MAISGDYRNFTEQFAQAVIHQDFVVAHQMLAPWLQEMMTPKSLAEAIQSEVEETLTIHEIEGDYFPRSYEVDGNSCSLEDLAQSSSYREPRNISSEVTQQNFRQWMVIQFQTSEEDELEIDAYVDMWIILVELGGDYKIGYFEMEDPD